MDARVRTDTLVADIDLDLPSGDRRESVIQEIYRATASAARR